MGNFVVIDTETNWNDQVMSIGAIVVREDDFQALDAKYLVLTPEYLVGGMYGDTLFADRKIPPTVTDRRQALTVLKAWFKDYGVTALFAYNASFDRNHLPELKGYDWYDIMALAAYRQYNKKIPADAECCSTGRLKRGFGVEPMLRLLSGNCTYCETHNALYDAMDELQIMRLLAYRPWAYKKLL